ncbi:MAG: hypothetical protein LUD27_05885 [Clostridia bacterium]|nr:hypothetical protein [Clostridia bacterium]
MKYRVVGWTSYDDYSVKDGDLTYAAYTTIIDEIRSEKLFFSGYDHQERSYCVPVLNDGKKRIFSQRSWGGLMAEAYGYYGRFDYSLFSYPSAVGKGAKIPEGQGVPVWFVPEKDLSEEITVNVGEEKFAEAESGRIKIAEEGRLRYVDKGDTLTLVCGDMAASYKVFDVFSRLRDVPDDIQSIIDRYEDKKEVERATEIAAKAPYIFDIRLKKI